MSRVLAVNIVMADEKGEPITFLAGQEVPAEYADQITNKAVWEDTGAGVEPPRTGRGATVKDWRAYAAGLGIEVPATASREDIIAAVDAHQAAQ